MTALITETEAQRLAKLCASRQKVESEEAELRALLLEREGQWQATVENINGMAAAARVARGSLDTAERRVAELRDNHGVAVAGRPDGEFERICCEAATLTAGAAIMRTIVERREAELSEALTAARKLAVELNVPIERQPEVLRQAVEEPK